MREFSRFREVSSVGTGMTNCYREGEVGSQFIYGLKLESFEIVRVQDLQKWYIEVQWQERVSDI